MKIDHNNIGQNTGVHYDRITLDDNQSFVAYREEDWGNVHPFRRFACRCLFKVADVKINGTNYVVIKSSFEKAYPDNKLDEVSIQRKINTVCTGKPAAIANPTVLNRDLREGAAQVAGPANAATVAQNVNRALQAGQSPQQLAQAAHADASKLATAAKEIEGDPQPAAPAQPQRAAAQAAAPVHIGTATPTATPPPAKPAAQQRAPVPPATRARQPTAPAAAASAQPSQVDEWLKQKPTWLGSKGEMNFKNDAEQKRVADAFDAGILDGYKNDEVTPIYKKSGHTLNNNHENYYFAIALVHEHKTSDPNKYIEKTIKLLPKEERQKLAAMAAKLTWVDPQALLLLQQAAKKR